MASSYRQIRAASKPTCCQLHVFDVGTTLSAGKAQIARPHARLVVSTAADPRTASQHHADIPCLLPMRVRSEQSLPLQSSGTDVRLPWFILSAIVCWPAGIVHDAHRVCSRSWTLPLVHCCI